MIAASWAQIVLYLILLTALAWPLGLYLARVYGEDRRPIPLLGRLFGPLERGLYRLAGVDPARPMDWKGYALALLAFSVVGFVFLYGLLRLQGVLPGNPRGFVGTSPDLAFNAAASFVTNTNWQSYSGETTMSHLSQMLGLTAQNFLSAALGMAVMAAFARGLIGRSTTALGNFWVDLTRGTLYVLLPLSVVLALILVQQGVVQTLQGQVTVPLLERTIGADGRPLTEQLIALGPAASQIAIKQLGTNGGGFFGVNSAHPLENPTALTNLLECLAILLIPAAFLFAFGQLIKDRRQGWALYAVVTVVFVIGLVVAAHHEGLGNPVLAGLGVDQTAGALQSGGNLEGKEARFGISGSALWAVATTAASNGSVNSMHDSFTPIGGMVPMVLIKLGEVIYGGVGSGLYGLLAFVLVAVFVAGLLVGRTPEYLGKKVEVFEMKMATLVVLIPPALVLLGAALAVSVGAGRVGVLNPGAHGLSEILYDLASAANNNGSAFAGLSTNSPFYNTIQAVMMLAGRYLLIVPILAIAGSLALKRTVPAGPGTLPTHTPLFGLWLLATILLVGVLTFLPALALGPIVEHLLLPAVVVGG